MIAQSYIKIQNPSFLLGHIVVTAVVEKGIGREKSFAHRCESVLKLNDGILISGLFWQVLVVFCHAVCVPLHLLEQGVEQLTDPDLIFREVGHNLRTERFQEGLNQPWSSWWKNIPVTGGCAIGRQPTRPTLSSLSLSCRFDGQPDQWGYETML